MVLGEQLVVWRHSLRGWVVQRDVCPHRLAPLSEGRLEAAGTRLACAYHGWEFDEEGSCTKVPQLSSDPRAAATACSSPRSCVTSYPTLELDGLLLVWMDDSKEGRQQAKIAPKPKLLEDGAKPILDSWFANEMPVDYTYWLEQGMDPSHANFLHHGALFRSENSLPMSAKSVKDVDLAGGFMWEHGAYEKKQGDMRGFREFLPPFCTKTLYLMPNGTATHSTIFVVPVRPGVCRTVGVFARGPPPSHLQLQPQDAAADVSNNVSKTAAAAAAEVVKRTDPEATSGGENNDKNTAKKSGGALAAWLLSLVGKLPHWVLLSGLITDQDLVMMSRQEVLMRREGLTARDYNLNSKADAGVAAANVWLKKAGYPESLWGKGPAPQSGPTFSSWPATELSLEQLLSRQDRHVRHCAVCQRGMKLVTAVCTALTAAAGVAAVAATILAVMAVAKGVAAVGGWGSLAGAVVAVVVLAALAVQGWSFREERFVSGAAQWRRIGGFSLVGSKHR
ncbi:hypothetical protein VOLCADRAFT_120385 [Volvox carteri f. nagariensis]|uniref:Rieske domain-containing protein n=1 Tax=Volvox carteri f. nagariensis TaxID=3068 RepID=D8TK36_VOLCA|nr:uncharacterized protein VOLCADRAFT_120385 [Volvox carteri f. nagariensis]EFJ52180.1 hypothetical protein VOLCADRAFT_120385 [Volvox carteri f. nagariensis]|eukprot:XP_002946954.1 hypothetical protein VOLCADRAFT_120385 [Volvox carteri f. nagariensis]